jgi:hypothetical protein
MRVRLNSTCDSRQRTRLAASRRCLAADGASLVSTGRKKVQPTYFGLSRCTTFTLCPAFRSRLHTSSAIMTERCCPPVQPKLIVR